MENTSHQWASLSLDHLLLPPFFSLPSPALSTPPSVSLSAAARGGLALAFRLVSLHPLFSFPCPYALTQAGRGSLACTLHLHVALPPQNNRLSNVMRLRYEETQRACVCVCACVEGERRLPFYCLKTNFLCADLSLCLCRQLVRPVTVVPNVPGIPGPPSPQPQPVQSEAKLVLIISSFIFVVISMLSVLFPN